MKFRILLPILTGLMFPLFAQEASRPNIIVFLVDDYDKQEASPYGGKVLTPNLDRLAKEGMLFHNTHVSSTVCTPSRYTFLTGRYAGSSTSKAYLDLFPEGTQGGPAFNVGLEADNKNVGAALSEAGYVTGYVGKYHVHDSIEHEHCPGPHVLEKQTPWSPEANLKLFENEKAQRAVIKKRGFDSVKNVYWGNMLKHFKGHNPEWTIEAAMEFVEANKEKPFYLHYCTTLLHGPNGEWYRSLVEKELMTGEGKVEKPVGLVDRDSVLKRIKAAGLTDDEVGYLWMDDTLGLLLDQLDRLGIAENTIVAFVSDHGSNKKGSLFKSRGTEIPCIVRWPNVIEAGSVTDELVQNTDFVPTWFEVAGAKPKDYPIDGVSLLPLLKDSSHSVRDFVYGEQGPVRSVKTKDWGYQAIRYSADQITEYSKRDKYAKQLLGLSGGISRAARVHPGAFDADQLYHYRIDPEEQTNLAGNPENEAQLKQMQSYLKQALEQFDNRPFGEFVPGGNSRPRQDSLPVLRKLSKVER